MKPKPRGSISYADIASMEKIIVRDEIYVTWEAIGVDTIWIVDADGSCERHWREQSVGWRPGPNILWFTDGSLTKGSAVFTNYWDARAYSLRLLRRDRAT